MTKKRILVEFGMGSSLRKGNYTKASERALRDALWRNSINAAEVFGFKKNDMLIDVTVGVQKPQLVDIDTLESIFPYGKPNIKVVKGGLDILKPNGDGITVIANVGIEVSFDIEKKNDTINFRNGDG
jgi:uncharacterized protein (TIGR02058 family)